MAGHSKWTNIKHKKQTNDVKKSKLFSKIASDLKSSISDSSIDLKNNIRLRNAVDKALSNNMSKSIINNIISQQACLTQEKSIYCGSGSNGVCLIIECFDLNKNRVVGELRHLLGQYDIELVQFKSIAYLFLKYIKLGLVSDYNDKFLFKFLNKIDFNKSLDDIIFLDSSNIRIIGFVMKFLCIEVNHYDYFLAKTLLIFDKNSYCKMHELILKLKKYSYISNVFFNF